MGLRRPVTGHVVRAILEANGWVLDSIAIDGQTVHYRKTGVGGVTFQLGSDALPRMSVRTLERVTGLVFEADAET